MSELSKIIKNNIKPVFMPPKMYKGRNLVYNASDKNYSTQYFAIVSIEDGNVVSFNRQIEQFDAAYQKTYYVSSDLENWTSYNDTHSWELNNGDILYFKAVQYSWADNVHTGATIIKGWRFNATKRFNVQGNIMSLLYGDDFASKTEFKNTGSNNRNSYYEFYCLFYGATTLVSAKNLILPARHIIGSSSNCYRSMFYGCTSLIDAPQILAVELGVESCAYMFAQCTSLTKTPKLSSFKSTNYSCCMYMFSGCTSLVNATRLPSPNYDSCYQNMFYGCTSLVNAPEFMPFYINNIEYIVIGKNACKNMYSGCTSLVNAPSLEKVYSFDEGACSFMFSGCTSLVNAPKMPKSHNSFYKGIFKGMFSGCTALKNAPELTMQYAYESCYEEMFYGCTSLELAPELPSTRLYKNCYKSMFKGCTSLEKAPQLNVATLAEGCYQEMFNGCSSLNEVTCLATDRTATNCVSNWLANVSATGTFYKNSQAVWPTSSSGIPSGWTIQNA